MRPRRLANASYRGKRIYFLTLCTFARRECFTHANLITVVWLQFASTAAANRFEVLAYCFMPDHLHLLVEGTTDDADLRVFIADAKRLAAHAAKPWLRGRLWQSGYYDRILRDRDDAHAVIKYILENPVRAGLAESPHEYPFIGGTKVPFRTSTV